MTALNEIIQKQIKLIVHKSELSIEMKNMINSFWDWQKISITRKKQFRWANLTHLLYEIVKGECLEVLPAAVAMEFFALAADIYDDFQDQDNNQVPWRKIPDTQLVNVANCLLLLSYQSLDAIEKKQIYSHCITALTESGLNACDGQYLEVLNEQSDDFSLSVYLNIAGKKAGSLTKCACLLGFISAEASSGVIEKLGQFGTYLGIMAQIENDLADILKVDEKSDLSQGKKTLPLIYLKNTLQGKRAKELEYLIQLSRDSLSNFGDKEKDCMRNIIIEEGAAHYCFVVQEMFRQKAQEILAEIPVPKKQKGKLIALVK